MKRQRRKGQGRKRKENRENGYYWVKVKRPNGTEQWVIGRWWNDMKFFDTMGTICDVGYRDKIMEVDENRLVKEGIKIKRRRRIK